MRAPLIIAGRVLYLSAGQRSQKEPAIQSGNITVHITRSNNCDISAVDYTICGISRQHVYQSCVENVNEQKQQRVAYETTSLFVAKEGTSEQVL